MMSCSSSLLYAVQHPTLLCVITSLHMLIRCGWVATCISSGLFHVWCVRLLFVIAVHHPVSTNWTPARTMMSYSHSSLQQPAASIATHRVWGCSSKAFRYCRRTHSLTILTTDISHFMVQTIATPTELKRWLQSTVHDPLPVIVSLSKLDLSQVEWPAANSSTPALTRVQRLNLSKCKLNEVPAVLRSCASLRRLELQDNPLKDLPDWLSPAGALPALSYLDVSFTNISTLPVSFSLLATLRASDCNQLAQHYKIHADSADPSKLMTYIKECAEGEMQALSQVTGTFVGPANVGKSIILECMTEPPPGLLERNVMKEHRARTRYPIITPHKHKPDGTAALLHVLFTDPPGILTLNTGIRALIWLDPSPLSLFVQVMPSWLQRCSSSRPPRTRCSWW